jgi:N-acetyl-anhydromuramyl-L-alanine amidase AmpD
MSIEISTEIRLSSSHYFAAAHAKDLIVLHHTAGASARSTVEYWRSTPERIGTAYIVERDGTIYEVFPPECWAYHLGIKGTSALDRRSIGIEIASEGALVEHGGQLCCFGAQPFTGEVFDCGADFRGYKYFAAYTPAALSSVLALVDHLLSLYSIPRQTPVDHFGADLAGYRDFQGVLAHSHLRADKTDVHPGFPWEALVRRCRLATVTENSAAAIA